MLDRDRGARTAPAHLFEDVARILALGVLRLRKRAALPPSEIADDLEELSENGLEVPPVSRLSVRSG